MRSIWQSLAWKEWNEHKWKLAALTGVLGGVTAFVLVALIKGQDFTLDGFLAALVMGVIPLTIFIAAGEAAGENAQRTMPFLQSLPVPMWKAASWKLVFGAITCLLPVLFVCLMISVWYFCTEAWGARPSTELELGLRELAGIDHPLLAWIVVALAMIGTVIVSLLIWTSAIGVNRKSEAAAGAMALVVIIAWWTGTVILINLLHTRLSLESQGKELITLLLAAAPGGFSVPITSMVLRWPWLLWIAFPVAFAVHAALALWFVRRFGLTAGTETYSHQSVSARVGRREWLGPPRSSPLSAIAWKQVRESGPIALAGSAAILLIFFLFTVTNSGYYLSVENSSRNVHLLLGLTMDIGFLVVLIAGVSVFDRDLSPNLHAFWRSRPIDPDLWYWTKYAIGLIALAVALMIPVGFAGFLSWAGPPVREPPFQWGHIAVAASVYWAVYALSLTTLCLTRVAIYAAILSAGALAIGTGVLWAFLHTLEWELSQLLALASVLALTVAVLATLVGWWAVRRDLGWTR